MTATGEHTGGDPYRYRPDLDPANVGVPSWVYLVHLDPPIEHTEIGPHAGAAHYTGSADDLPARTAKHGTSEGARLLQLQRERGGSWHIACTWPGGKYEERAIKQWRQAPRLCPDCTPGTQRAGGRTPRGSCPSGAAPAPTRSSTPQPTGRPPTTRAIAHLKATPSRAPSPRSSPQPWTGCANPSGSGPRPLPNHRKEST